MSKQMAIPGGLDESQMEQFQTELQAAQERVRDFAEANLGRAHGHFRPL
jgi:hypothetical protein